MENLQGTLLKGYKLEERIGTGGFGAVYRAKQTTIGREVAVKIILPGYANNPDFIRRFESEAHLIARLEHPHITPLHDFWRDPEGAYLVMRFLRNGSIRDALANDPYDLPIVSQLLDQIASGLDFAHRNDVIHRDIKPGNILLDEDGNAYLADFGIAKDLAGITDNKTAADAVVGSLDYISPEQARSEPVTPRTDIYSLGVTLYEMITGEHPFHNTSTIERLYKHINDPLPEIINLPPDMRDVINDIIQKATAKDPDHRYPDVLALAVAFREGIGHDVAQQDVNVVEQLTMREHEVLALIANGFTNRDIAGELIVSIGTVKWHINSLYKKLEVRSRVQAIVRARELNLIANGHTTDELPVLSGQPISISLPEPENPYKGLHSFQMTDARDFFGRDDLVTKLIDRMTNQDPFHRFVAIVGPSGSGKSSLAKAGLIPALWKGAIPGSEKWYVVDMIPGSRPLDKLEIALMRISANQSQNLRQQLERDDHGLSRVADLILPGDNTELVIVVDQFEEVFTLVEDETTRQQFLDLLRVAVSDVRSRVRIVVTLRADYYDRPLHYPEFGELIRSRMETVLPLSAKGLERAVRGPTERVGVTFEQGLVEQIVSQMNYQAGALPLLQYALTELFDRRQGRLLTNEAYQEIGGAIGALANRADEIYRGLTEDAQELAHQMFMRLVTLGEGAEDARRRVTHAELLSLTDNSDLMEEIIDQFAAYRLLSLDHDPETRQPTVEVAHEAILREWDSLRQWLNESRDDIRQERAVSRAADDWKQHNQDPSYLLRGVRLEQVEKWNNTSTLIQTPLEQDFIAESLKQREKEQQVEIERKEHEAWLEQRSRNFLRGLVVVFVVATVLSAGFGIFALTSRNSEAEARQDAEQSSLEFRSVALTFGAQDAIDNGQPDVALSLAREAVNMQNPPIPAQQMFFEAATSTQIRWRVTKHSSTVFDVDYSPDGQQIVTVSWDGSAIIQDIVTGKVLQSLQHDGGRLMGVSFHPSDELLAITSWDDSMLIFWDLDTDEVVKLSLDAGWLNTPTFFADGERIAVNSQDGHVFIFDVSTHELIQSFEWLDAPLISVTVSPDETLVSATNLASQIRLWDITTGEIVQTLTHASDTDDTIWIFRSQFLADGELILTGGGDSKMHLWHWRSGEIVRTYEQQGHVQDITLSPDDRLVATGDDQGRFYLWDVKTGRLVDTEVFHAQRIRNLEYSPDGRTVLTASTDGTAGMLDIYGAGMLDVIPTNGMLNWRPALSPDGDTIVASTSTPNDVEIQFYDRNTGKLINIFVELEELVAALAYSPDGRLIISGESSGASTEGTGQAYIWDAQTGDLLAVLDEHSQGIASITFSNDGKMIAIAETQGARVLIWDTQTLEVLHILGEPNDWVNDTVFSPNDNKIYGGSRDGTIYMWNPHTGEFLGKFVEGLGQNFDLTINGDGSRLISTNFQEAIVWDTNTGRRVNTLVGHTEPILSVVYSPDEYHILTSSEDDTLILWDANTGEPINRLVGHSYDVVAGYFSEDGQTITSVSNYEIMHWDVATLLEGYKLWIVENRYIPDFTCEQRELYIIEPLCGTTEQ